MSPAPNADCGLLLTEAEQDVIQLAAELWNAMCAAIPDGPTRANDLAELVPHIHAVQHAFMANAAARAYPETYRLLGSTLRTTVTPPAACYGSTLTVDPITGDMRTRDTSPDVGEPS